MFGVIMQVGTFSIFFYGFLLSLGFLVTAYVFWKELGHTSFDDDQAFSLVLKSLFWAFIISRLIEISLFYNQRMTFFFNWRLYPGINGWSFWLSFWLLTIYQSLKNKLEVWRFLDILSWLSFIFLFWLSLACFGGWCWLSKTTHFKLAWPIVGYQGLRYPVSLFHLLLVLFLLIFFNHFRFKFKSLSWYKSGRLGFVFWLGQSLYAIGHFLAVDIWLVPLKRVGGFNIDGLLWLVSGLILMVTFLFWADIISWPGLNLLQLKKKYLSQFIKVNKKDKK